VQVVKSFFRQNLIASKDRKLNSYHGVYYKVLALHSRAYGARSHLVPTELNTLHLPPASSLIPGRAEREPAGANGAH